MRRIITLCLALFITSLSIPAQIPKLGKEQSELKGQASIVNEECSVTPVIAPVYPFIEKDFIPVKLYNNNSIMDENLIPLSVDSLKYLLKDGEFTYFTIDTRDLKSIAEQKASKLSAESQQAIQQSPLWLEDQLSLKLSLLHNINLQTEKQYANLIINTPEKLKDEVAFVIANMSLQSLTDSRFVQDRQMIIRNAEFIYSIADSLQYVKLIEKGDYNSRDYYTTTSYRIYDPETKDTIWSEIPRDIYYWYIVHPKLDQEGVYVADNSSDASGQRTYGYSWRDFIWKNPDPAHDYRNVNKSTSKGSVTTIPVFGELIKSARILWDRNKTYYTFNRPLQSSSALDLIGNWCSRALPVDVTLPRAFQPNQIIMKHDGMCNEDAFLVAAACRTALIPIIYLGTWCEDHVFGSVYDEDWNHFEFFRGGLAESGNQFYGITNMLDRGSYGWKNSMVEGFRPDGFPINFSTYYANTCILSVRVVDKNGNPIDGAMLTYYASPNAYNNNYSKCGNAFTNKSGYAEIRAGEAKKYLVQAYHPKFGWSPSDSTKAFNLTSINSVANMIYRVNVVYDNSTMPDIAFEQSPPVPVTDYTIKFKMSTQDILTGVNNRDSQRSRFYLWNAPGKGNIAIIICDSINFEKYRTNQTFTAIDVLKSVESADYNINIPADTKWYIIMSNQTSSVYLQNVTAECGLYEKIVGVDIDKHKDESMIFPNPFNETLTINANGNYSAIRIYDIYGNIVTSLAYPANRWTPAGIADGIYTIVIDYGNHSKTYKAIYYGL